MMTPTPDTSASNAANRDTALIVCRALLMIVKHLNKRFALGLRLGDEA